MNEERTINLETRCHECIFAKFENNIQIGCELGRSDKFQKQGKAKRVFLDNTEAFQISTVCNTYRDKVWAETSSQADNIDSDNIKMLADCVRDFVTVPVSYIIVEQSNDGPEEVSRKIAKTAADILTHDILPKSVIFVVDNDEMFEDINKVLDTIDMILIDSGIEYRLVRNLETPVEYYRLLDVGVSKTKTVYYTHCKLGDTIPKDTISLLDHAVNNNLWTVSYVEAGEDGVEVIQTGLHKIVGGNEAAYLRDKVHKLAESQEVTHKMIYTWDQLHAKKLS